MVPRTPIPLDMIIKIYDGREKGKKRNGWMIATQNIYINGGTKDDEISMRDAMLWWPFTDVWQFFGGVLLINRERAKQQQRR